MKRKKKNKKTRNEHQEHILAITMFNLKLGLSLRICYLYTGNKDKISVDLKESKSPRFEVTKQRGLAQNSSEAQKRKVAYSSPEEDS